MPFALRTRSRTRTPLLPAALAFVSFGFVLVRVRVHKARGMEGRLGSEGEVGIGNYAQKERGALGMGGGVCELCRVWGRRQTPRLAAQRIGRGIYQRALLGELL